MNEIAAWPLRRWGAAVVATLAIALAIGLPTDVIPNPVFGRPVDVTWWSYPVLVVTAVLGGLLLATYVRVDPTEVVDDELDRPGRTGGLGGLLSFFAVGCPTCNKLVIVALARPGRSTGLRRPNPSWPCCRSCCSVGLCELACTARRSARLPSDAGRAANMCT